MNDCVFCKIVDGSIPSYKVAENDHAYAFLDIHPANHGHTLVIPKRHAVTMFDTTLEEWLSMQALVHKIAAVVETVTEADGLNIKMNNRVHGGQDVMHAHVHIVPRFKGDGVVKPLVQKPAYPAGEAERVRDSIISEME